MTAIPYQWRAYFSRQAELDQRCDSTSTSWGLEAGLSRLLDQPSTPHDADRAIAAGARRNRYANALLAKYVIFDLCRVDGAGALEARSSLTKIERTMPKAVVSLLLDAARGENAQDMAARFGISEAAFHTRLSRARASARKLAA